ncbi:Reverse transcriptase [Phytophthora palmivora]|uniref:Reverse transcriptase n=1 Tax=Phytophthora palmivora TaxID=4796 RepID=A0A2P4YL26_9STRA|nr:Reverse transcriptase [Phytophthora palmivora]
MDEDVLEGFTKRRVTRLGSEILKNPEDPVYPLVKESSDVMSKHPPSQFPPDRGCEVIDAFFAEKAKSGMMLIPRKDVLLNNMSGCTLYSALDLVDGYYQILMRESDIPLTAVSTPSGMLWEWLVIPQGLSNAPATRAEDGQTAMAVHLKHIRRVCEVMRANKLYANIEKCVFAAEEIKVLGCFVSRVGVRADPGKVKAIAAWPTPRSQKDLRKWLSLANYLHKYSTGYVELARPLSDLSKKDADWVWEQQHHDAFDNIKASLQQVPVTALSNENKSFSVVCDASDYAIGCALLRKDDEGRERVISFQFRQLKAAERNYPVHDKELLAMMYALVKF